MTVKIKQPESTSIFKVVSGCNFLITELCCFYLTLVSFLDSVMILFFFGKTDFLNS